MPCRLTPGVAATVGSPTLDTVSTAPRGVLDDGGAQGGRGEREELRIVGQPRLRIGVDRLQSDSQSHFPVAVMMAVSLTVGRDMGQPRADPGLPHRRNQSVRQRLAVFEEAVEGDLAGERPVVEEDDNRSTVAQIDAIGDAGVDPPPVDIRPGPVDALDRGGLVRGKHGELDPLPGQDVETLCVDRRLR